MKPYDLIAIDIDGTLLDSHNAVSPTLFPILREVEARGIGLTLISGRPSLTVEPLMRDLGLALPYVSSGGAYIGDLETHKAIAAFTLQRAEVQTLADIGREFEVALVAMEAYHLFYEGDPAKFKFAHETIDILLSNREKIHTDVQQVADILQVAPTPLKFTFSDLPDTLGRVEERLRASNLPIYFTYSSPFYLETTNAQANKGTALTRLARHLNIPLERVMAIGDSPNDLSMLQVAGCAVAMGNARPEVKEAAQVIAPSNDEDGVAWVLRELLLKD